MLWLYRLVITGYHALIRLAAWFSPKAKAWVVGRRNWEQALSDWRQSFPADTPVWWMHCASLGEFEQGRPVLAALRAADPEAKFVLSFYSPSGYEARRHEPLADWVTYLPADSPGNAQQWVNILQPQAAIFVKYEFWLFHLQALFSRQIPTFLIAASFRKDQIFFRWYGGIFRSILPQFTHIFTQHKADVALLGTIGMQRASAVGDPRIDRVVEIAQSSVHFPRIAAFCQQQQILIAGSTWPPDEKIILEHWAAPPTDWKLIIAPHDVGEAHIQQISTQLAALSIPHIRYTQWDTTDDSRTSPVMILDTIGMLSRLYHYGNIAYIGGGFGTGIHNTLEPVAHGLPVIFGPKHHKFPEATRLQSLGAGFSIESAQDFTRSFELLQNPGSYQQAQQATQSFIAESRGATKSIMNLLVEIGFTNKKRIR